MTKFSFTINTDDVAVVASLIAMLGGGSMVSAVVPQITISGPDDEDDNAPMNTAAPALDVNGLPWDERIHAKTKSTNKDGSWKKGRGVTDAQIAQVEAELRARTASPIPNAGNGVPPSQPPSPAQPSYPSQPAMSAPAPAVAPVNTPAPQSAVSQVGSTVPMPQPPAQIPAQPQAFDFGQLMTGLNAAMMGGRLDTAGLAGVVAEINGAWGQCINEITDLAQQPEKLEWVKTLLINRGYWIA